MGIDITPFIRGETIGERLAEEADRQQRAELARRLEAVMKQLDELHAEIADITLDVEGGA
jgi:hypothetical protein